MDKFDQQIIALLTQNARQTTSEIARQINLSRSATQERIRQLEVRGIIKGYYAKVEDPEQKELLKAYFEVQGHGQDTVWREYAEQIETIPEIQRCDFTSGQVDLIAFVEAASMRRIEEIRTIIEAIPTVTLVRTHMVMRTLFDRKIR
ncbi:Lrp/AsnC family transcriptional regulator [Celerinatantimonas sp. YJH-8]|uniref:Lrp/AsnC family transcriptional regulator n=1 Tax=Celerinatantimonas sp. YJH-8 TaxID=3228714 RepID=UPI0038C69222